MLQPGRVTLGQAPAALLGAASKLETPATAAKASNGRASTPAASTTKRAQVAPDPPATPAPLPSPTPATPDPPVTAGPIAAPAPAPTVTNRTLTQNAPVVIPVVTKPTVPVVKSQHHDDHAWRGYRHFDPGNGDDGKGLASQLSPAPVDAPTPTPVVTIPPPSVGPPLVGGTPTSVTPRVTWSVTPTPTTSVTPSATSSATAAPTVAAVTRETWHGDWPNAASYGSH